MLSWRNGILLLLVSLLPLAGVGCDDRGSSQARQELVSAKAEAERLKFNLEQARQEISELEAELNAVRQSGDALQQRIAQLVEERDDALGFAAEAQKALTRVASQAQGQATATAEMEREIVQLRALVDEQQELIEQFQQGGSDAPVAEDVPDIPPDTEPLPDPNDGL
jgi:chromosome segregation ATPase